MGFNCFSGRSVESCKCSSALPTADRSMNVIWVLLRLYKLTTLGNKNLIIT